MTSYQVLSRKYRPQRFADVMEQSAIVTTLRNAILHNRISNAYLFCGCRGTGKTTLARLFAKSINCEQRSDDGEPCNQCSSCIEIASGHSLDVLEIDGASNRGIDDIRELNENAFYAPTKGRSKIYIIDEVHMLTKEAFNALLKTLEEPPANVNFFFATTEPHKIPPTIISRCQRFNLKRLSIPSIVAKLQRIIDDQEGTIEEEALALIAKQADGSMRDAESLLDQALCSLSYPIPYHAVSEMLGVASKDLYFSFDRSFSQGELSAAFSLANKIYEEGKDIPHFIEGLAEHFRTILMLKLGASHALTPSEIAEYEHATTNYSKQQCLAILEQLNTPMLEITKFPWKQIHLEMILLNLLRAKNTLPIDTLVARLEALQTNHQEAPPSPSVQEAPLPAAPKKQDEPKKAAPLEKRPLSEHQKNERLLRFTSVELNGTVKK